MSIIRIILTTLLLLLFSKYAFSEEEDYFAPVVKEEREVLETMMQEIGFQSSDIRIYKAMAEPKITEGGIASKILYRKKINGSYKWEESRKKNQYAEFNGGLPKSPNIVINKKGHILAINITKTKIPFEHSNKLSHFKALLSFGVFSLDACNDKTVKNLPKLKQLKELSLNCRTNIRFPDLSILPDLYYLIIRYADLNSIKIPEKNSIKTLTIDVRANTNHLPEFKKLQHLEELKLFASNRKPNHIIDLSWLSAMPDLKKLDIHGTTTEKNFSALSHLKKLTHLDLTLNSIESLPGLAHLNELESLELQMHQLTSLPPLKHMTKLKSLDIEKTQLSSLDFLTGTTSLINFDLFQSPIRSMKPLETLVNLENLELGKTIIRKIEGLDNMIHLKSLEISECPVTKIEGLDNLQSLEALDLSALKINKMENLDNLKNLKKIFPPKFNRTKENFQYLKNMEKKGIRIIF